MNYADIKQYDISNGPGVRISLFVSGCNHHCKGCFNQETWDFNYGKPFTKETIETIIEYMKPDFIKGLTVLGGEPFERVNQQGLLPLLRRVREVYPGKDIWCFTGFDFMCDIYENMYQNWEETREMVSYLDIIVDGKFIEELKDLSLRFKGSSNQKTIMVQETLKKGEPVLWDDKQIQY